MGQASTFQNETCLIPYMEEFELGLRSPMLICVILKATTTKYGSKVLFKQQENGKIKRSSGQLSAQSKTLVTYNYGIN